MPILRNAKKALRVSERRAVSNRAVKSKSKTAIDTFKATPNGENLKKVFSAVDKTVKKNIIHRNKAARIKSQLSKLVSA